MDHDGPAAEESPAKVAIGSVSEEELAGAEKLLQRFCEGGDLSTQLKHTKFKGLRRAVNSFFAAMAGKERRGNTLAKEKHMLACRRSELRNLDRDHIRKTQIRQQRIAQLAALETDQSKLLICGGGRAADEDGEGEDGEGEGGDASIVVETLRRRRELFYHRGCYVCKRRFVRLHHFYSDLCPECAALNWRKRTAVADLRRKVVLVTGARVKVGFECGVRLLRCGATVLATSRFPHDTVRRYAALPDSAAWIDRLHVYAIDLRDLTAVVQLTATLCTRHRRLDAIVNNAAQTVRRPPAYYRHLLEGEAAPLPPELGAAVHTHVHSNAIAAPHNAGVGSGPGRGTCSSGGGEVTGSAAMSQMVVAPGDADVDTRSFPVGNLDVNGQQVDLRKKNSWTMLLAEIDPAELVEVFAVNALAPFIICSRLKPLLLRAGADVDKFIVNVSAMEGKFYRFKGAEHPHTNMAKSALNQLVRTSAQDYAADRIYMNAVDTGWITDENPFDVCVDNAQRHWQTPIDEVDAAARVLDPIISGISGSDPIVFGKFLKDYHETEW